MAARRAATALLVFAIAAAPAAAATIGSWSSGTAVTWGGPQDGKDPNQPSGGLLSGSCGYGEQTKGAWPFWSVVAVSPQHPLATDSKRQPKGACGACLQLECVNDRPGFEASYGEQVVGDISSLAALARHLER